MWSPVAKLLFKSPAAQVFHNQIRCVAMPAGIDHAHDVRMVETLGHFSLAQESLPERGLLGRRGSEHLDGHLPAEGVLQRQIDVRAATLAQSSAESDSLEAEWSFAVVEPERPHLAAHQLAEHEAAVQHIGHAVQAHRRAVAMGEAIDAIVAVDHPLLAIDGQLAARY